MQRWVGVVLGLIAAIAGIGALWTYLSESDVEHGLVLTEVSGQVSIEARDHDPRPPVVGEALVATDRLRTGAEARAVLSLGSETRIRLGPESSLEVGSVGEDGVQVRLEDGALEAIVRPGNPLRVANNGREVVATNAEFAVGVRDGVMQVETRQGEVGLAGTDQTLLEAGSTALMVDRKAVITPIPEALLLEVRWPETDRTRAPVHDVVGKTVPGARVTVTGPWGTRHVTADADGAFTLEVPLEEGGNQVTVHAVDPLGRSAEVAGALLTRDTLGPRSKSGVIYGN